SILSHQLFRSRSVVYLERADKSDRPVCSRRSVMRKENFFLQLGLSHPFTPASQVVEADVASYGQLGHENATATPASQSLGLGPRRHAKQEHIPQGPPPIGQPGRHGRCTRPPAFHRACPISWLAVC